MNTIATKKKWAEGRFLGRSEMKTKMRSSRGVNSNFVHAVCQLLQRVSVCFDIGLGGDLRLSSNFKKWFENGILVVEVVVYNVHKVESIHHAHN